MLMLELGSVRAFPPPGSRRRWRTHARWGGAGASRSSGYERNEQDAIPAWGAKSVRSRKCALMHHAEDLAGEGRATGAAPAAADGDAGDDASVDAACDAATAETSDTAPQAETATKKRRCGDVAGAEQ